VKSGAPGGEHLPVLFLGIAAVELIVILGLYWVGLHFGS
jgi:hypothetical protein